MLSQYTDNPEGELRLKNVEAQLLRQWMWEIGNYLVDLMVNCINDNWKLCKNRNMHRQQG